MVSNLWYCFSGPRVKSVTFKKCNIRDRNQQVLVLEGGVLKAVPDKDVTARGDSQPCFTQQKWFLFSHCLLCL